MAFIDATRQNMRPLDGVLNYSAGGRSTERLPRTGLLARMYIHVQGTMSIEEGTGSVALHERAPWNIIDSLSFKANQGMDIFRMSGFDAHILDITRAGKAYDPSVAADKVFSAGVQDGDNDWDFTICVNVTPNERDLLGLILLQTDQMSAELEINWSQAGSVNGNTPVRLVGDATASFAGKASVLLETFIVPADPANRPDLTVVYQQLKRTDAIDHVGEIRLDMLRANLYSSITHIVTINGALADPSDINSFKLRYNNDNTPYSIPTADQLMLQRRRYGRDLPKGVYVHDLFYQGVPGFGGQRDLINAGAVAEFASLIDVNSNATLGSGNNRIETITQQFVQLAGGQS